VDLESEGRAKSRAIQVFAPPCLDQDVLVEGRGIGLIVVAMGRIYKTRC